jgi:ferredoxin-NADP reductase
MSAGVRRARLSAARALTHDTNEYRFEMVEPPELSFRPGQFVSVACTGDTRRSYSIASSAHDRRGFALLVKIISHGVGSGFFTSLRPGNPIEFTGPMGFFVLELAHPGDVIMGATGTGIAPVLPMLEELGQRSEPGRVRLFWGLREPRDLFWSAELDAIAARMPRFQWSLHLTKPTAGWSGPVGRITEPLLEAAATADRPVVYLVGNGDMIKELRRRLPERGIDRKRQIRTEAFFAASAAGSAA